MPHTPTDAPALREFSEWLNARRDLPVAEVFHDIVARFEARQSGAAGALTDEQVFAEMRKHDEWTTYGVHANVARLALKCYRALAAPSKADVPAVLTDARSDAMGDILALVDKFGRAAAEVAKLRRGDDIHVPVKAANEAREALKSRIRTALAVPADMVEVCAEDANNYCKILTLLGMEEEGDPVDGVRRLIAERDDLNEAAFKRVEALVDLDAIEVAAQACSALDLDTAQDRRDGGVVECPCCHGEGDVNLESDFCNFDGLALGVQFYGIGPAHGVAERYLRIANPRAVLELVKACRAASPEAAEAGWQPIETAPKEREVFFWLVPKTEDESYTDTSGRAIVANCKPYWKFARYGGWSSTMKAVLWREDLAAPPAAAPEVPT